MKPGEPDIIDVPCNSIKTLEIKKTVYRGLDIYAVKRSIDVSNTSYWYNRYNTAWWCGYVEVPADMRNLFSPKGYLDDTLLDELGKINGYNLAKVHGGYTYIDYGIPLVLDGDQRAFLGWDYNHWGDTEAHVTYNDIINEGKEVVDSMLEKIKKENSNG